MARPFLFDTHFPQDAPPDFGDPAPEPPPFTGGGFTEADLEAVRDRAFRQGLEVGERDGFERGQQLARQSVEAQQAQALAAVEQALGAALSAVAGFTQRLERDAVKVVTTLVTRLAPPLQDAVAEAELDQLVIDSLHAAMGQPRLELRVAPTAADRLRPQIQALAAKAGYRGVVEVLPEPGFPLGTAKADWGTGGAERDPRLVERQLADAVAIAVSRLTTRAR